jgi:hypothetical protein
LSEAYEIKARPLIHGLVITVALLSLLCAGLALRSNSGVTTETLMETSYVTEPPVTSVQTLISTSAYTVTQSAPSTSLYQPFYPEPNGYCAQQCSYPYNNPNCGYPFNPWLCNEGPPETITGMLVNDTGCVDLYVGGETTYVVWNLPQTYPQGAYQVYGFVYPNWPQTEAFPPYPFQTTLCVGIPMWSIPPYIQSGT